MMFVRERRGHDPNPFLSPPKREGLHLFFFSLTSLGRPSVLVPSEIGFQAPSETRSSTWDVLDPASCQGPRNVTIWPGEQSAIRLLLLKEDMSHIWFD